MVGRVTTIVRRNAPASPAISRRLVRLWGDAMLSKLDRYDAELSVLLTDDVTIRKLNCDYRQKDRATDVLSFHFDSSAGATASPHADWLLGDIVISLDTAQRQAVGRKRPLAEEVRWLLAHGLLHLCGHDHANPKEKRVMVAWTRRLVRAAQAVDTDDEAHRAAQKPHTQAPSATKEPHHSRAVKRRAMGTPQSKATRARDAAPTARRNASRHGRAAK
jgi:probable rRNA maturation factor